MNFGPEWITLGLVALFLALWIWALVDGIRVPDDSMCRTGNKLVWVLVIAVTGIVGALIYMAIGRPSSTTAPPSAPRPPPPPYQG